MLHTLKKSVLPWLYALLLTLLVLELGVRISGYSERHIYDPIYMPFEGYGDIPYIHKPNLAGAHARGHAIINTDSLGLRSMDSGTVYGSKGPNEFRIAIVGDSVTFGEGIPDTADTYAQVLEDRLNETGDHPAVTVFNYGASAYSVKEMAATLEYRMALIQPDLVVMAIIPDDFKLSRTPVLDGAGYLTGKSIRFVMDSPLRNVLRHVHLLYVLRDMALYRGPAKNDSAYHLPQEVPGSYAYIQRFREVAEQRGLAYIIVLLPLTGVKTWDVMAGQLSRDGIRYLDLSPVGGEFTLEEYRSSRYDYHPSPAVHRRIGEELAEYIQGSQFGGQIQMSE